MIREKGYTLLELMVTIIIVVILASVAVPIMRGRIDSAKWTEGKAMAGSIASSIRIWVQGWAGGGGSLQDWTEASLGPTILGFQPADLDGKHFDINNFSWVVSYDGNKLYYVIKVTKGEGIWLPDVMELDESGSWSEASVVGM